MGGSTLEPVSSNNGLQLFDLQCSPMKLLPTKSTDLSQVNFRLPPNIIGYYAIVALSQ